MGDPTSRFVGRDELLHPTDPDDWSWNESWFFSWIDLDGGPAGFFRVGLLPNQQRAMLGSFVHVDDACLGIEESRLAFDDFDLSEGLGYDIVGAAVRLARGSRRRPRDGAARPP